MILWQESAAD